MPNAYHTPGLERLAYGEQGVVMLRGQSGLILELQGDGPRTIQWAPDDKRATELEIRMAVVDWQIPTVGSTAPPQVRWTMTYGHGVQTWNAPPALPPSLRSLTAQIPQALLPQRGCVIRQSVREMKLEFRAATRWEIDGAGGPTAPPPDYTKVMVSMQPVYGSAPCLPPNRQEALFRNPAVGSFFVQFPPEANEFRVFDANGQPFALGVATVRFNDLGGTLLATPLDANKFATFQPIPPAAAEWGCAIVVLHPSQTIGAEYR